MGKRIDVPIGTRFGRLLCIKENPIIKYPSGQVVRQFLCLCDCGQTKAVRFVHLWNGTITSCGCKRRELLSKHGMYKSPAYAIYQNIKQRCHNVHSSSYDKYGGRGIKVCERWLQSFENFYEDMGEKPSGRSLDRIDNEKGYSKDNCRWATPKEQSRNTRRNVVIEHKGVKKTMAEWAEDAHINYETFVGRIRRGWDIEKACKPVLK